MSDIPRDSIDFEKGGGIVPAVVQNAATSQVLMVGYMSKESLEATVLTGRVTFYSRSKDRLWTKGETSGNHLEFLGYTIDCDGDALLIQAVPTGPVCHTGASTCFVDGPKGSFGFLGRLEDIIDERAKGGDEGSYTHRLLAGGPAAAARKVGEEAVEVAIAALEETDDRLKEETADLLYHLLVLLKSRGLRLHDAVEVLRDRHGRHPERSGGSRP
jgi:phosphoribosyl-ATP pyrophosphohydrolase/phosphoribosyl-AMP cyclohydrolase